jgi:type I restriction enzyme S subunit
MNNYQLSIKNYQFYKDSGIAWLGDVPEHWEVKRVKEVGAIKYGLSQPPKYLEEGLPLIRATNIERGKLVDKGLVFISPDDVPYERNPVLRENDILVVRSGAYTADSAIVPKKYDGAIAGFDMVLRPCKIYPKYLSYALLSNYVLKDQLILSSFRAAQPHLNKEELGTALIAIPPLAEQKSIATYLDTKTAQCDRKIDLLTQKATQYGKLKQSLVNETVTRGLDKSVPMKDSGVEWIGKIPKHWKVKRFKEIFNKTHSGWTPDTTKQESFEGSNVWVTIRDMNDIYISDSLNKLSDQAIRESGISLTPKGSLLFSFKLSIGKIAFAGCDLYTNEAIISIEEGKNINLNYFYYTLPVFLILNAKENIYGAKLLNQSLIFNTSLLYPPLSEQKAIADYLDTKTAQIDQIIQTINTQIEKLKELRKTLINDVVTGKIKVIDN